MHKPVHEQMMRIRKSIQCPRTDTVYKSWRCHPKPLHTDKSSPVNEMYMKHFLPSTMLWNLNVTYLVGDQSSLRRVKGLV